MILRAAVVVLAAFVRAAGLSAAKPGDMLRIPLVLQDVPIHALTIAPVSGPTLLVSDQPETFPHDGIALWERVEPGPVRLYLYHLPSASGKTITAVVENLSDESLHARFLRYGAPHPSQDYYHVAQKGLLGFFAASSDLVVTVAPRARAPLDAELDGRTAQSGALVHAFYEIELDQPARISVLQRGAGVDSADAAGSLHAVARGRGGAGRGQFRTADFEVTAREPYDTASGAARLVVADGVVDPWIQGADGLGGAGQNKGNYGALYRFRLKHRSTDGRALALVMSGSIRKTGGICGGLATAVRVERGVFPAQTVSVPAAGKLSAPFPEAVVLQRYGPVPAGETGTIEFTYSPPGSACLPTPLVLVPYKP